MKYLTCIHSRRRENSRSVKESCPKARAEKKGLRIPDAGLCESCKSYRRVGNLFAHPCDTGAKCPRCGIGFQPLDQEGKEADEKAISAALKEVMERHPEWKAGAAQKAPDKAGADEQDKKPEAKGALAGKVIF